LEVYVRRMFAGIFAVLAIAVPLAAVAIVVARAVADARDSEIAVLTDSPVSAADAVLVVVIVIMAVTAVLFVTERTRRRERDALQAELARQKTLTSPREEVISRLSHEVLTRLDGLLEAAHGLGSPIRDSFDAMSPQTSNSSVRIGRDSAGVLIEETSDLARVVEDLLAAAQIEKGGLRFDIEDVDVSPAIDSVIAPFLRCGASITFARADDIAQVDRNRFAQVIRNLVSNAVAHGGPNIDIFTEFGGNMVSVFVMDDGDGIPDEAIAVLFDRHQHEGDEPLLRESVGLGLAVARALALGMGGSLSYTRTNGLTYFVFKVPSHRVGRLNERVDDQSLGSETAARSASQVAKLFAR
jgi:two-component system sensor histidine kinase MtrB